LQVSEPPGPNIIYFTYDRIHGVCLNERKEHVD
jgi:hypothetical protein